MRAALPGWLQGAPSFDLALCDPPYDYIGWPDLLNVLDAGLVVVESAVAVEMPSRWVITRERRYGGTLVTVAQRSSAES